MQGFTTVDDYIAASDVWQDELMRLRKILQSSALVETVKWGAPCYTHSGKNVVGMASFKSYVGLWFHQGALLADEQKVLINAQEGKTRALRQWRFHAAQEINTRLIRAYVNEAIKIQASGLEIKPQRKQPAKVPPQLEAALGKNKKAKVGFQRLTPGKQREYAEYIAEAKREATKLSRVQKIIPMIQAGKGLNDKYGAC